MWILDFQELVIHVYVFWILLVIFWLLLVIAKKNKEEKGCVRNLRTWEAEKLTWDFIRCAGRINRININQNKTKQANQNKEICYMELAHVIFGGWKVSWDWEVIIRVLSKTQEHWCLSSVARQSLPLYSSPFSVLFRPWVDWVVLTHVRESYCPYWVYWFKC